MNFRTHSLPWYREKADTAMKSDNKPNSRLSKTGNRLKAVVLKESRHILRDRQTLAIIIAMPVMMMFLYGYALTLDLNNAAVIVEAPLQSRAATSLVRSIDAGTMFSVEAVVHAAKDPVALMRKYNAKALLRIPPDFERDLRNKGTTPEINVLIDGSDQNTGTIIRNVMEPMIMNAVIDYLKTDIPPSLVIDSQILYNPRQKSSLFFIPGLMAIILIMISALLTSLTITREKETGTMEQLLVSPLRSWEIIAGKISPYIVLAAADGVLIMLVGRLFFGVGISGSTALLAFVSIVYIITSLALGLIFSSVAKNQQQAMLMVLPATMLPTIVLSGFIFPIRSMPLPLQILTQIIPATHYLTVIRGIILKGVGLVALWQPFGYLVLTGAIFLVISVKIFKVKL
ncbi:MAG: ABC transporter permease subunit [Chitinivibrionales bacterium]|nr:ABC transporter permease subunit [Chitinivibrionales bacterium]